MKHTPGPWKAHTDMDGRHRHLAILTEAPEFQAEEWPYHPKIATALHGGKNDCPREVAEANARLIAAAPELLEALDGMLRLANEWDEHEKLEKARTVIAKATGKDEDA